MTKNFTLLVCIFMLTIIYFGADLHAQSKALKQVQLSVQMSEKDSCAVDTMRLYAWTGIQVEEISKVIPTKGKNGFEFNFNLKNVAFGNYYLGRLVNNSISDMRPVLLGLEDKIVLKGTCAAMQQISFVDSKVNSSFESMVDSIKVQGNEFVTLITEFQQNTGNKEKQAALKKSISDLDFRRKDLFNRLKKEQPELSKIVALYTYQSFHNNQKTPDQTEGDYIGENYFQFANLADSSYLRIAFFYEAFKSYASNLVQVGLTQEQVKLYLDKTLSKVGNQNPHYKPALLAAAFGVMANNKKLFLNYAEQYQKMYRGQNQILDNFLDQQIAQLKSSTEIGDEAPDFSAATPEGGTKSLKSLRGKVLLVDFWASWCGPCRRENPNVVAVYNKYKDKGFDVLGVSLDNDATRWKNAIQEDKLTWHHVSDLGGWRSAPAQLYKVTGIPQTLLLDKNGVIIAKNLRGPALEEKLKEIFGENEKPVNVKNYSEVGGLRWDNFNSTETKDKDGNELSFAGNIEEWKELCDNNEAAYCFYNFDKDNSKMGLIYNHAAVRVISPKGKRVPTKNDFETLLLSLGNSLCSIVLPQSCSTCSKCKEFEYDKQLDFNYKPYGWLSISKSGTVKWVENSIDMYYWTLEQEKLNTTLSGLGLAQFKAASSIKTIKLSEINDIGTKPKNIKLKDFQYVEKYYGTFIRLVKE